MKTLQQIWVSTNISLTSNILPLKKTKVCLKVPELITKYRRQLSRNIAGNDYIICFFQLWPELQPTDITIVAKFLNQLGTVENRQDKQRNLMNLFYQFLSTKTLDLLLQGVLPKKCIHFLKQIKQRP